eukprot:gene11171-18784_t
MKNTCDEYAPESGSLAGSAGCLFPANKTFSSIIVGLAELGDEYFVNRDNRTKGLPLPLKGTALGEIILLQQTKSAAATGVFQTFTNGFAASLAKPFGIPLPLPGNRGGLNPVDLGSFAQTWLGGRSSVTSGTGTGTPTGTATGAGTIGSSIMNIWQGFRIFFG